uniref:Uncharacterized protein n=1 Tax=Lepeophtheirus salmonis TaxID=72036 RepID=A0A0K2T8W4_LEPSM
MRVYWHMHIPSSLIAFFHYLQILMKSFPLFINNITNIQNQKSSRIHGLCRCGV